MQRLRYFWRRLRETVLVRSGVRRVQFMLNERRLQADVQAGKVHIGRIPAAGIKMIIHPCMYMKCAYVSGVFEAPVMYFIRDWLRPGDTFIDVGANVGLFTLFGARCVGPSGYVFAFEPARFAFEMLERNCQLNALKWVHRQNIALGECNKEIVLNEGEPGFDAYTTVGSVVHPSAGLGTFTPIAVRQMAGDDWLSFHEKRPIRLIKIDVEGAELGVINGLVRTLSAAAIDAVLVEITEKMPEACGFSSSALWEALVKMGYSWFTLSNYGQLISAHRFATLHIMYVALRPGLTLPTYE